MALSGAAKPLRYLLILLWALAWNRGSPLAETPAAEENGYTLRIESQPLARALQDLAVQAQVQIIFFSSISEGLKSPALNGRYTLPDALSQLLAGSRLTFRMINPRTVEIRSMNTPADRSR